MNEYILYWSPTTVDFAKVIAKNARAARKKSPYPYRKYLGEINVELVFDLNKMKGDTMILQVSDKTKVIDLVRRMFYLAYNACGTTSGLGFLQAQSNASEDDVWNNVMTRGDYPGGSGFSNIKKDNEAHGDYVFGRMMKLNVRFNKDAGTIEISDRKPDIDYNRWAMKYNSHIDLAKDAASQIGVDVTSH